LQLKSHIPNIPSVAISDAVDLVGKSFNAFDMTMSGTQIATAIREALTSIQPMRSVADASQDRQAVSTDDKGADVSQDMRAVGVDTMVVGHFMSAREALGP